jgi:ATP-dependent Lon protease
LFTTGVSSSMIGLVRIECSINEKGSGKFDTTGLGSSKELKEAMKTAQSYFKANAKQISQTISLENKDYLMNVEDLQGVGVDSSVALAAYVSYCSAALARPVSAQLVLLGSITIGGTINKVTDLANTLQVCFDSGAKKVLLPMSSAPDIGSVPAELFAKFQTSFYTSPEDAVIKALGIE